SNSIMTYDIYTLSLHDALPISIAYYIVSRLGNLELTRILTIIEENFQKIFFNVEQLCNNFEQNLKFIYKHFYNYLPCFFGHGFKDRKSTRLNSSHDQISYAVFC